MGRITYKYGIDNIYIKSHIFTYFNAPGNFPYPAALGFTCFPIFPKVYFSKKFQNEKNEAKRPL